MQIKVKLSMVNLNPYGTGTPCEFNGAVPISFNRFFISDIEAASEKIAGYSYIAVSSAVFKPGTTGAGGKDDIEYSESFAIDLDGAGHEGRPDVKISIPELAKSIETLLPGVAAICYQSKGGNGAHIWFPFSTQLYDADMRLDYMVMILDKLYNSEWKPFLDDGAFTQERKMYIGKGTEPIVIHGEPINTEARYYESNEARDAIYTPMNDHYKEVKRLARERKAAAKAAAKGEQAAPAAPVGNTPPKPKQAGDYPDEALLEDFLRVSKNNGLIGAVTTGITSGVKWTNICTASWKKVKTNPQWAIHPDCKNVRGHSGGMAFKSIMKFADHLLDEHDDFFASMPKSLLSKAAKAEVTKAAKALHNAAYKNDTKSSGDKLSEKDVVERLKSKANTPVVRQICQDKIKEITAPLKLKYYRRDGGSGYKNAYHVINGSGWNNVLFTGTQGGDIEMKIVDMLGEGDYDNLMKNISNALLDLYTSENERETLNSNIEAAYSRHIENTGASTTFDEFTQEVLEDRMEQNKVSAGQLIRAWKMMVIDKCRHEPIKDQCDIKPNNSLQWDRNKQRLECWMDDKHLFGDDFQMIAPEDTTKIYTNDNNARKKPFLLKKTDIDMEMIKEIQGEIKWLIRDNPRLMINGRWQGYFISGLLMCAIMSSYLGFQKARPVLGIKGAQGLGKSFIVDLLISYLGDDFGLKRSGLDSEPAIRRGFVRSGILGVDDNLDKEWVKQVHLAIIKALFDGKNIVKCNMSADAGGGVLEFPLNALPLYAGTVLPTDDEGGNAEAESRMTILNIDKADDEDKELAYRIKEAIPECREKNEKNPKRTEMLMLYLISNCQTFIVEYKRIKKILNKFAADNRMNNGNRRADTSAALLAGYKAVMDDDLSDETILELFAEYGDKADQYGKIENYIVEYFTTGIITFSETVKGEKDGSSITRKQACSIKEFTEKRLGNFEDAEMLMKFFADSGVFLGGFSEAKGASPTHLIIAAKGGIHSAETVNKSKPLGGKNMAADNIISNLRIDRRIVEVKKGKGKAGDRIFYSAYADCAGNHGNVRLRHYLKIDLKDVPGVCNGVDDTTPSPKIGGNTTTKHKETPQEATVAADDSGIIKSDSYYTGGPKYV